MKCGMSDPDEPDFSVGVFGPQTTGRADGRVIHSVGTRLDVDSHDPAVVARLIRQSLQEAQR